MFTIENDLLKVAIDSKGAELKSVFGKIHELEYMWQADPAYWAKTSPVLFPVVGALKENTYYYQEQSYHMSRHGFARDKVFTVTAHSDRSITFSLESDAATFQIYPFHFLFSIHYTLHDDTLTVAYHVQNRGEEPMYFSVGGHPAFRVPLAEGTSYDDYTLTFDKEETAGRWLISREGLIEKKVEPLLERSRELRLKKELFQKDAIVLKQLQSHVVQLGAANTPRGVRFTFSGFPYLGLWAAPGADFLCIEPWWGIADSVDADQQLVNKEGIISLPSAETYNVQWNVQFY